MSRSNSSTSKPVRPAIPLPWPYRSALFGVALFVTVAGFPYAAAAVRLLVAGQPVRLQAVQKQLRTNEMRMEAAGKGREVKAVAVLPDGTLYLGGKAGLAVLRHGQAEPVTDWPDAEVKSLASASDGTLWVVGKEALWRRDGGSSTWNRVREGDAHSIEIAPDGMLYLAGKTGLRRSRDGQTWEEVSAAVPSAASTKNHPPTDSSAASSPSAHEG